MKLIVLSAIFSVCGILHAASGDDWLPPPDGYKWPKHSDEQLTDEHTVSINSFPKKYQEAVAAHFSDKPPTEVIVRKADLNGDRKNELFIYIPEASGTGGTVYAILSPAKDDLIDIGAVQGGILLCEPVNGWLQIEGSSKAGGGHFTRYLLQYKDNEYQTVRNEDHNLISGVATVRKTEQDAAANP
jgi:hypothetical protein